MLFALNSAVHSIYKNKWAYFKILRYFLKSSQGVSPRLAEIIDDNADWNNEVYPGRSKEFVIVIALWTMDTNISLLAENL